MNILLDLSTFFETPNPSFQTRVNHRSPSFLFSLVMSSITSLILFERLFSRSQKTMLMGLQTVATAADMGTVTGRIKADGKQSGATVQIAPGLPSRAVGKNRLSRT
jgi:hypothetical protein